MTSAAARGPHGAGLQEVDYRSRPLAARCGSEADLIDGEMKRRALQSAFTNITPPDAMPLWHQDKDVLTWLTSLER